jgi:hypothetical protein
MDFLNEGQLSPEKNKREPTLLHKKDLYQLHNNVRYLMGKV